MFDLGSIFGIDITGDGKADLLDDLLVMEVLEDDEERDDDKED